MEGGNSSGGEGDRKRKDRGDDGSSLQHRRGGCDCHSGGSCRVSRVAQIGRAFCALGASWRISCATGAAELSFGSRSIRDGQAFRVRGATVFYFFGCIGSTATIAASAKAVALEAVDGSWSSSSACAALEVASLGA